MIAIIPDDLEGARFTQNGISVDVDSVKDGEVYFRRWPKGVETQAWLDNCHRLPLKQFITAVAGAKKER